MLLATVDRAFLRHRKPRFHFLTFVQSFREDDDSFVVLSEQIDEHAGREPTLRGLNFDISSVLFFGNIAGIVLVSVTFFPDHAFCDVSEFVAEYVGQNLNPFGHREIVGMFRDELCDQKPEFGFDLPNLEESFVQFHSFDRLSFSNSTSAQSIPRDFMTRVKSGFISGVGLKTPA